jgi:hypothetical protein
MLSFLCALFYMFLPIWVLTFLLLLIVGLHSLSQKLPNNKLVVESANRIRDFLQNEKRSAHYFRAFVLITALSYWVSKDAPELIYNGLKFTVAYVIVNALADYFTENRPW